MKKLVFWLYDIIFTLNMAKWNRNDNINFFIQAYSQANLERNKGTQQLLH